MILGSPDCDPGLDCPALVHEECCIHHPSHITVTYVSVEDYGRLMDYLERPARVNKKLRKLVRKRQAKWDWID